MNTHYKYIIGAAVAASIIAGGAYYLNQQHTQDFQQQVVRSETASPAPAPAPPAPIAVQRIGPPDIYPPSWATGEINRDITQANIQNNICNPNWSTKSERPPASYTTPLKIRQLQLLGYADQNTKNYEEDHVISLELGGSPTSTYNLWPEPYHASISDGGARSKDLVENALHKEVCDSEIGLA